MNLKEMVRWIDEKDEYLVFPKLIFFFVNFILYTTYTYQLDYLADEWNLNITTSGFITSIPVISFFFAIAWSGLAQRTGRYKEIIVMAVGMYGACFMSFWALAPIMKETANWQRFLAVSIIYGSMSILGSAFFPLLDHKMYVKLAKDLRFSPEMFGRQRLWGTVGQGVAGYVAGWGINKYGYAAIFIMSGLASIVFIGLVVVGFESSSSLSLSSLDKSNEKDVEIKKTSFAEALRKLMRLQFVSFLLVILVASYARAIVGNYLVRYLKTCLNISKDTSGLLILIRSLPEIFCLYFSKNLLEAFGVRNMLLMGQVAGLVRVTMYAWLPQEAKWLPFGIESLRGVNNAFLMASGVRLAHELAPVGAQTVAQGFFHGIYGNLTTGTAGILASLISLNVKKNNPELLEADIIRIIFKVSSIASIVGLLFFGLFYVLSKPKPVIVLKA